MMSAYVATFVAGKDEKLSSDFVQTLADKTSTARVAWLADGCAVDLFYAQLPTQGVFKQVLQGHDVDVLVQPVATRRKKLLIADMESTIIEQEMLDELADLIGLRDQVTAITRRAMNGELDFEAALKERVLLLKGQPVSILEQSVQIMTPMAGARELLATMKGQGAQCWLVSGGFTCFVQPVAEQLGFDCFYANELIVKDGVITGEVAAPILDKQAKKVFLEKACAEFGLSLADVVAVGDGANDIPMLASCHDGGGLGVAYHAKPNVRAVIGNQINHGDLITLLYAQGYSSGDITSSL